MLREILRMKWQREDRKTGELGTDSLKPDFIPYSCHYDGSTLLLKDGGAMQVIKITGFMNERIGQEEVSLRSLIRKAVYENVKSERLSVWLNTVRVKTSLEPGGEFSSAFSLSLNSAWNQRNGWSSSYVNELYITILIDGPNAKFNKRDEFFNSLKPGRAERKYQEFLKSSLEMLNHVTDGMLLVLKAYGARKLTIVKSQGDYYSEPLRFLYKILNLIDKPALVPAVPIDQYLSTNRVAFGFNSLEVAGNDFKRFGAILIVKEYHELSLSAIDKFLQIDQEFMVTQTLSYGNYKSTVKEFKRQRYIAETSKSIEFAEAIGLKPISDIDATIKTDYSESQLSIFIIGETLEKLDENVEVAIKILAKLGVVAFRLDLRLEQCFWSQLPGNFRHLEKLRAIRTDSVGGFASLYNFPAGSQFDNRWGPAVTVFHTAKKTPYFFSFHYGDNGHSVILGPKNAGKTVLLNFLISEATKYNNKLFFLDQDRGSKVFIKALGGYYAEINPYRQSSHYAFNPMLINDSPDNRMFLTKWLMYLAVSDGSFLSDADKNLIVAIVDYVFKLPMSQRRLSNIAPYFGVISSGSLAERMSKWHSGGKFAHLFDNDETVSVRFNQKIYGFDMLDVIMDRVCHAPLLLYLLHMAELMLDGTPTIIVLDEAWNLIDNPFFAKDIEDWMDRVRQKNGIVLLATESVENTEVSKITASIRSKVATKIFLPNPDAEKSSIAYKEVWGLNDEEFLLLQDMTKREAKFLLKRGNDSVVAMLDLYGMKQLNVLSGSYKTVRIMEELVAKKGDNPDAWLPEFYEKV